MALVSGSSGFGSRRTMLNQHPSRDRRRRKLDFREALDEVMTTKLWVLFGLVGGTQGSENSPAKEEEATTSCQGHCQYEVDAGRRAKRGRRSRQLATYAAEVKKESADPIELPMKTGEGQHGGAIGWKAGFTVDHE
eukprot:CAMPEP_0194527748 /NCGR_PEP_ID=MMETSP0253-20130528/63943_1 /TAXON_ID=2966 /ORGANISM="Noctiluca scintillans" /LENGTH=135 /DNA_ID=CAMNT_0039372723 /DNA_START=53 /DNA_END=461 /DNA_ORIENTATION=+